MSENRNYTALKIIQSQNDMQSEFNIKHNIKLSSSWMKLKTKAREKKIIFRVNSMTAYHHTRS